MHKIKHMKEFNITLIQTENPAILKFQSNHFLVEGENFEFRNIDEAKNSPLAQQLFYLPFIKTVYISGNFIALERFDIVEWNDVQNEVAQQLVEYLNTGAPVILETESEKKLPTTVYAEVTPNPSVLKFVANRKIVPGMFEFKNIDDARVSELATLLFQLPYVKEVFMDENYISITKYEVASWDEITMELREKIRDFLSGGQSAVSDTAIEIGKQSTDSQTKQEGLDQTSKEIISILDQYVKPAVASDGGNILFQSYEPENKTVNVILQGACSGCPSSTYTLRNGIETMLKNMLGDKVEEVVAING